MIIIPIIILFVGTYLLYLLACDKDCPYCGNKLIDKVPNGYRCRHCGKLWHKNLWGKLKERKRWRNSNERNPNK